MGPLRLSFYLVMRVGHLRGFEMDSVRDVLQLFMVEVGELAKVLQKGLPDEVVKRLLDRLTRIPDLSTIQRETRTNEPGNLPCELR